MAYTTNDLRSFDKQFLWHPFTPMKLWVESYPGDTVGAMSVGRVPAFHKPYFPMLFKVHFAPSPYAYRFQSHPESVKQQCLCALETVLREHASRIAAICIEPMVQGAGGMI